MADIYKKAADAILDAADKNGLSLDKYSPYDESLRQEFLSSYSPDKLSVIQDSQLLRVMFMGGGYRDNFCNWLMFRTKDGFGNLGGYPSQFGVYNKRDHGWTTNGRDHIDEIKALEIAKAVRDNLMACSDVAEEFIMENRLYSPEDYIKLQNEMARRSGDDSFAQQPWVRKYFYLLYPEYFATWFNKDYLANILAQLGIKSAANVYGNVGQLIMVEREVAAMLGVDRENDRGRIASLCWEEWKNGMLVKEDEDPDDGGNNVDPVNICIKSEFNYNRILFGAPGTGKSYILNQDKNSLLNISIADEAKPNDQVERVIFYPDYSYANFVGTYKPVSYKDSNGNDSIKYTYVPGPFMRTYIKAWENIRRNSPDQLQPYVLVIEEINRASAASVFGDIFQLLDRNKYGYSEYSIQASEDIRRYLKDERNWAEEDCKELRIPGNMFIWATMNSADQGVFPMDTAFKRRWNFEYIGIGDDDYNFKKYWVTLGKGADARSVEWQSLRIAINDWLADNGINEDKQIGPYFITPSTDGLSEAAKTEKFNYLFTNKIIMYLFEDAARQRRNDLFSDSCTNKNRYSKICNDFINIGIQIFNEDIQSKTKTK
ncbi:MAG: AAA family ATPase [Clostridia bacterium]|nr:AAA family ATPase [Clostridia bacterium]